MSTHKHIDRICLAGALLSLLAMLLFAGSEAFGVRPASQSMGYEARLFDTTRVHTIEIVMDGWEDFLETCENEEYAVCSVVVDGEAYKNIGIRAKGNTSLNMVSSLDSDRYSFKLEFDHYDSGKTYYGLDKLCLNNLIQDNTMMKDYLTYQLMASFDVAAPLCSFVYITVNGQDWGLYLAVEGVEEAFLQRNYGKQYGDLYKPDSLSMGGGRGNGRDFDMDEFMNAQDETEDGLQTEGAGRHAQTFPAPDGDFPETPSGAPEAPVDQTEPPSNSPQGSGGGPGGQRPGGEGGGFGGMGGMGSSDVKLQYIDDDPASYANIFDSAKTGVTEADQTRLIQSLKALSEGDNLESVLDIDAVLRYFVVHNYVCNGDSYTGNLVHNYYLYEKDGQLSMIPWDYNLAFGGFQTGDASSAVNDPIDTPQSVTGSGDRPMIDWIFSDPDDTALYHQYFEEFLASADPASLIAQARELIAPYVEKDPTKFCTYEDFETAVEALAEFCRLRTESVAGQLAGTIPSTSAGQSADSSALVDASGLNLADMGNMNQGGGNFHGGGGFQNAGGGPGGFPGQQGGRQQSTAPSSEEGAAGETPAESSQPEGANPGQRPEASSQPQETDPGAGRPAPEEASADSGGARPEAMAFPDGGPPDLPGSAGGGVSTEALLLLGVSLLLLLAGILVLRKYRRWGG